MSVCLFVFVLQWSEWANHSSARGVSLARVRVQDLSECVRRANDAPLKQDNARTFCTSCLSFLCRCSSSSGPCSASSSLSHPPARFPPPGGVVQYAPIRHYTFNVQILQGQGLHRKWFLFFFSPSTCCQGLTTCGSGGQSRFAVFSTQTKAGAPGLAVGTGPSLRATLTLAHEAEHCPLRNNGVSCVVPSGKCFGFFLSFLIGKGVCLLVQRCSPYIGAWKK